MPKNLEKLVKYTHKPFFEIPERVRKIGLKANRL